MGQAEGAKYGDDRSSSFPESDPGVHVRKTTNVNGKYSARSEHQRRRGAEDRHISCPLRGIDH